MTQNELEQQNFELKNKLAKAEEKYKKLSDLAQKAATQNREQKADIKSVVEAVNKIADTIGLKNGAVNPVALMMSVTSDPEVMDKINAQLKALDDFSNKYNGL